MVRDETQNLDFQFDERKEWIKDRKTGWGVAARAFNSACTWSAQSFPSPPGLCSESLSEKHKTEPGKLRFVTVSVSWVRGPILAALSSVVFPLYRYGN